MDQSAAPVKATQPHVLIFPYPAQGHVSPMLQLAELLCLNGLHVTFVVTVFNYARLLNHTNVQSRFSLYRGFHFEVVPDGLPEGHPRSVDKIMDMHFSLSLTAKPHLREKLASGQLPVTFIITDGLLGFMFEIGQEAGIPVFYFRTISACAFWAGFCIPRLIESGELPSNGNDLDIPMENVPGMEGILRRRDLPQVLRDADPSNPMFQMVLSETQQTCRVHGFILNTFEDLEGPALSQIRTQIQNVYAIGPLNAHLKTRLAPSTTSISSNSLWEEDRSCINWLDKQPKKSVIYVSFGSFTVISKAVMMEFWHGLVNSGRRFLWVMRPGSVTGNDESEVGQGQIPVEVAEGTKERGRIVRWAPQEELLGHPAVGGFLTHSGWNSTLEAILAGVPMLCWPYFADQQVNSRFVDAVWKIGLDTKDKCDRDVIQKMIENLMEISQNEFNQRANQMAKLAEESVSEGGSSYCSFDRLIADVKRMSV